MSCCGSDTSLSFRELIRTIGNLPVAQVLDLGCGTGKVMGILSAQGLKCTGIDPSIKSLRTARNIAPVALATGDALPFRDSCFDAVVLKEVIHHVKDPTRVLAEAGRCLKEGGYLWILDPVEDDPILHLGRNLVPYWRGMRVESRFYARQLVQLIIGSGFHIVRFGGEPGGFPHLLHWLKEALWELFKYFMLTMPEQLQGRIKFSYQGTVLYYWCLATKGTVK